MQVYLDQNVLSYIADGMFSFPKSGEFTWLYSDAHFEEIRRGDCLKVLDVLASIDARKISLILDDKFRITDSATIAQSQSPHEMYEQYLSNNAELNIDDSSFLDMIVHLAGGEDAPNLAGFGARLSEDVKRLLREAGLESSTDFGAIENSMQEFDNLIEEIFPTGHSLDELRNCLSLGNGRATALERNDNPIESLWRCIRRSYPNIASSEEFFGFAPVDTQNYDVWPIYLGIVGCHVVLNFLGYRPDKGLNKTSKVEGVSSDGAHIGHAAFCGGLISADQRLCAKARAIYRYKNINVHILQFDPKDRSVSHVYPTVAA